MLTINQTTPADLKRPDIVSSSRTLFVTVRHAGIVQRRHSVPLHTFNQSCPGRYKGRMATRRSPRIQGDGWFMGGASRCHRDDGSAGSWLLDGRAATHMTQRRKQGRRRYSALCSRRSAGEGWTLGKNKITVKGNGYSTRGITLKSQNGNSLTQTVSRNLSDPSADSTASPPRFISVE